MRQKVRRISKSTISVLLAIMMVASLLTVGIVNTSAVPFTFTTSHKIYFDATKWTSRSKVYVNFLNDAKTWGNLQEMTQIGSTGIYRYENSSVSGGDNFGVMFVTNNGWDTAGSWDQKNSYNNIKEYASNCTKYYGLDLNKDHVYYFRASSANKDDTVYEDKDYNDYQKTINHDTVRNTDRVWAFNLTATSSVATTEAGTPATGNASSSAGGKITVNASYFNGWDSVSDTGDCADSSTTTTYSNAAKGCTATWKVKQVYSGYEFDGWYSDASSTGETNRLSTDQNYSETVTGDFNGTITRYAHFHRAKSTVNTAVSPSGAGTAYISASSTIGTDTSVSNITDGETVYLQATANTGYTFSKWRAATGLTYADSNSASTTATVTANATATAEFTANTYTITKQNPEHARIKVPAEAAYNSNVKLSATTDLGHKVSSYKYSTDNGAHWTTVSGDSFTMPAHDVVVSADVVTCATYQVTMTTSAPAGQTGVGSVSAVTSAGQKVSSDDYVNDGTVIIFTASPAENNAFMGWSGTGSASSFSGTATQKTATITARTTVDAAFQDNLIQLINYGTTYNASGTGTSSGMTLLDSGYYRSNSKIANGVYFTVSRKIGNTTTYAKSIADGDTWWVTDSSPAVTPQHWTSDATMSKKYYNNMSAGSYYVFYDPAQNKIWLSTSADGSTGVTIYAKDGSFTANSPGDKSTAEKTPKTSSGWGNTTLVVSTNDGSNWNNGTNCHDGNAQYYTLNQTDARSATTKIKVSTTVTKANYYVYGFDINGCITKKATKNGNAYEYEFYLSDIETNTSNFIEITPIYMLTDPSLANPSEDPTTVRFYVRGFAGEVESRWGGELYCYSYQDENTTTNGNWPGQPMVSLGGGTYYMDLPLNTNAITLSNGAADWIHAKTLGIDLSGAEQQTWDRRNKFQCQTYDYDDFQYIYAKPGVGENDEDIIFDFRYKQGEWGISGKDNFNSNNTSAHETDFETPLDPGNYTGWEMYVDYYDEPIDLWGTKLTSNYDNNPVRVVVQGYYDTTDANGSYYATTYVVYKPTNATGDPGEYTLVAYTNSSAGYGKKSRSEFLQRTAAEMGLTDLAGQPVEITYEYAIYKNMSTKGSYPPNQNNQYAERADGVWYYSETKPVKGKVLIQYADNMRSAFSDDTFAIDTEHPGIDYDGDDYTVNEGTTTHAKAYFEDNNYNRSSRAKTRPTTAPLDVDYDNKTVEWAYTDGYDYYNVKAEDPADGEYTFVGWYKVSSSGIDLATTEYTYEVETTTNETFIARYVKVPSGVVKLAHKPVVTGNSGGNGERKVWYDIVDSNNVSVLPSGTTQEANGAITVPKTYVKHDKGYTLKVKFQVVADQYSKKHGIYSTNEAVNANLLNESNLEGHNHSINVENFTLSPSGTTATVDTDYVTFSIPMDRFFKLVQGTGGDTGVLAEYEFDTEKSLIEVFSDFEQLKNNINITKSVDYNNGESFTVKVEEQYLVDPNDPSTVEWQNYSGSYTIGNDTTTHTITNGEITISGNQTIHIKDAPAGTVFRITENALGSTSAYTYTSNTIFGATGATAITRGQQFTMPATSNVDMTFKNSIKTEDVVITKTVEGGTPPSGTTFPIHVTYQTTNGTTVTAHTNEAITTLAVGTNVTLSNVPVGSSITISEDSKAGYVCKSITGNSAITDNNDGTFTVVETNDTPTITVANAMLHDVSITKVTDYANDFISTFKMQVLVSTDGDVEANYHHYQQTGSLSGKNASAEDITASVAQNGSIYEHPIHKGDTLSLTGLQPGTWVKILETDTTANYTHYGTSVTGATNATEITPSSGAKGIKFQIGSADPLVTITNHVIKQTVTVNKKTYENLGTTAAPNLVDFPYEDDSRFGIEVLWKPLGTPPDGRYAAMPNGSVKELSNSDATPAQPDANNLYWVGKDGSITFTNVPKGSFITVTETDNHITDSDVTKAPRFLFFNMVNTGAIEHGNSSSKYYSVGDSAVSFEVQNIVKKNTVTVTKSTNNQNSTDAHTIKIHIYKNGWASSTGNTPDEYQSISYTSSISGPENKLKNSDISIHGGETLTFSYPVGCVFTIQETAPHANYDIKTEDNGAPYEGIRVTGVPLNVSGIANPTYDSNSHTLSFQTADAPAAATIYNEVKTKALTITKATNASSTTDTFKIKLYKSPNGTTWTQYTAPLTIGQTTRAATNGEYTISKNESLVMSGIEINTYVKIEESDPNTTAGYRFDGMSGGNVNVDSTNRTGVVQMDGDKTVTINNSLITRTIQIKKTVDYTYDNETSFPITVEYKDTTDSDTWKTVSGSPTSITASDSWTDVTLNGQPAVSEIRVTETLNASTTHYGTPSLSVEGATKVNGDSSDTAVAFNFDGNNTPQVTIANHAKTANVTVKKELITGDTNSPFAITLSHKVPGANSFTDVPYSLAKNATSTALSLPVGTIVKVTEAADTVTGYELDSMQTTVDSAATAYTEGTEYVVTEDNVLFTVKNKLKTFTVTIVKEVENEAGTPISDSTDFNISYTNGTAAAVATSITKGNNITVSNVPYGTTFTVSETNLPRGYQLASIGNGTNTVTSGELATTVTGNTTVTVTNTKLPTYTLTLSKNADGTPGDTEFGITVSSATANGNYSYQIGSNASVAFDSNSKVITLKSGESAVISGLLAGETLTFEETNPGTSAGYMFDHFTVNGSDRASSVTSLSYEVSAEGNAIVVNNVKSAPDEYRYKITYTYPSRFQFIPEKASRFGDQSYTVEGVLLSNDQHFSEYFDTANSKITKALILNKAPHESNFMMNMTWDKDGDNDSNFSFDVETTSGTTVYTGSVSMIEEEQSTKNVQFIFPYATTKNTYPGMCKVVYVPSDFANPVELPEKQTTPAIQVEYQGEVVASETREVTYTENGETKTKNETFYFHTTAPSQFNGGNFLYWSIRAKNVNTGNFVEVARSYNEIFNYTIFDNYQIEPIYDNYTGVATNDESNYKATAQFAKLNLLSITRNQWNNDAKGTENVDYKGEDMVYLDFDLAYAFNDYMLSKNSKTLETGLLIQDCGIAVEEGHPLNLDGTQAKLTEDYAYYTTQAAAKETAGDLKTASQLQALVLATDQACGTSGSKTEPEKGLTRYAIGKLLTNKNRYELGVTNVVGTISEDNPDVLTGWSYDASKKTHVYRAYAYIRNTKIDDRGVILSEPVYFTMKNIADQ